MPRTETFSSLQICEKIEAEQNMSKLFFEEKRQDTRLQQRSDALAMLRSYYIKKLLNDLVSLNEMESNCI